MVKGLVMFSTGLKESILQPLIINYYGFRGKTVANILSAEILTFAIASVFIGMVPESKKN